MPNIPALTHARREIDPRKPNVTLEYYEDLYHFVVQVRDGHSDVPPSLRASMRKFNSWSGDSKNLPEACERALNGWPEGLAKIDLALAKINAALPASNLKREYRPDVVGLRLSSSRYLIDHPKAALRRKRTDIASTQSGRRVVKIYYNYAISANVGSSDKFDTGAAVVSLIDQLEKHNYSCELILVNGNYSWRSGTHLKKEIHIITYAKRAGEFLSLESIAFLLCSTEMDRRLAFSLMEQWSAQERKDLSVTPNYPGAMTYYPPEAEDGPCIKIGAQSSHDLYGDYDKHTPAEWVQKQLAQFGITLGGE